MNTPVSTEEALRRIDLIIPMLALDVRRALVSRAFLQVGNGRVIADLSGLQTQAAVGHAQSQNAHRIMLSVELARIFDVRNRSPEKQDKASLPILSHYLGRDDVRTALTSRTSHVERSARVAASVVSYLMRWQRVLGGSEQVALSRLRAFRDYEVSHSIFDKQPDRPTYADLFRLCTLAAGLVHRAETAVDADETDFRLNARIYRQQASAFWGAFTVGVLALDQELERQTSSPPPCARRNSADT